MSKKPLVTVLMPAYNSGKFLEEAVDSILKQSYKEIEFLIIDDGSTDGTTQKLQKYAKKNSKIKLIAKKENKGYEGFINNLNEGLTLAKGKYIARMDSDDISMKERIAKQVEYMESHPEIDILGTGAINIFENGDYHSTFKPITKPAQLTKKTPLFNTLYHPTVMMRADLGLKYRLRHCEDYDLWLQAVKEGKQLANLSEPLLKYRVTQHSLSRGNGVRSMAASVAAQKLFQEEISFKELNLESFIEEYQLEKATPEKLGELFRYALKSKDSVGANAVWRYLSKHATTKQRMQALVLKAKVELFTLLQKAVDVRNRIFGEQSKNQS